MKSSEYGACQPLYSFSDCAGVSTDLAEAQKAGTRTCHRMIGPPSVIWYGASSFEIPLTMSTTVSARACAAGVGHARDVVLPCGVVRRAPRAPDRGVGRPCAAHQHKCAIPMRAGHAPQPRNPPAVVSALLLRVSGSSARRCMFWDAHVRAGARDEVEAGRLRGLD
jgi:hypothetical protein